MERITEPLQIPLWQETILIVSEGQSSELMEEILRVRDLVATLRMTRWLAHSNEDVRRVSGNLV